jgi:hypothetical protein
MGDQEPKSKPEEKGKKLAERLRDFVDSVLDELQSVFNPPRPVRVPVSMGPRRYR